MKQKGISLLHYKNTENSETQKINVPEKVLLPMLQHMGAECSPLVKVGDEVTVGQKIGDSDAFMSTPIHSSASGKVTAISDYLLSNGKVCKAVEITTDGNQTVSKEVVPPQVNDKDSFIKAVKESGCCGLGGAGFPTYIKLMFDPQKTPVDCLVVNGAECEPYITADYREMMENTDDIYEGINSILKYLNIKTAYIGIENNKPLAIKKLTEKFSGMDNVKVMSLKSSYPQGAEKVLIYSTTKRIVKEGELPSNQGCLVMNISTIGFINRYLKTGMPLISKRLTVDGDIVKSPCNVWALTGTPVIDLLNFAQADVSQLDKLISGGPMMGLCLYDTKTSIIKTNNAILAFKKKEPETSTNCIRCGRCAEACPVGLLPALFEKAYDSKNIPLLKENNIMLCINCGSCEYVCPAKRKLAEKHQLAKVLVRNSEIKK